MSAFSGLIYKTENFRLTGGGGRRDQDIAINLDDGEDGTRLDLTKLIPALVADPATDGWMELVISPFKRVGYW
jgi:hypothetical protein